MYAIVRTGGKQYRVEPGQKLQVELLSEDVVTLEPVMVVGDDGSVRATPAELAGVTVHAKVVGEARGPKINGFTYKSKTRQRRRWGHRQRYHTIEITDIDAGVPAAS